MDLAVTATEDLIADEPVLRSAFSSSGLTIVGDVETYYRRSAFGLTAHMIIDLIVRGGIAGLGGAVVKAGFDLGLTRIKLAIEKVRASRPGPEKVQVIVELRDDAGPGHVRYVLPIGAIETADALAALAEDAANTEGQVTKHWTDEHWVADDDA